MNDKLAKALAEADNGDVKALIGIGIRSAFSDERCGCAEPDTSMGLMCRKCLKHNDAAERDLLARRKAPHPFEIDVISHPSGERMGMCSFCTRWRDDPRHEGQGEHRVWGDFEPEEKRVPLSDEQVAKVRAAVDRIGQ
mgnify:CR=1 FL=1